MKKWLFTLSIMLLCVVNAEEATNNAMLPDAPLSQRPLVEPNITQDEIDLTAASYTLNLKSPVLAASLSWLIPGLGHTYLGDYKTAGSIFGSCTLLGGLYAINAKNDFGITNVVMLQNTYLYSMYAAYRDARIYNHDMGFTYPMPKDSLSDLVKAPFQWSIIKKPEVWGGVIGMLSLGIGISYFLMPPTPASIAGSHMLPINAFPVGIGEEAFFRGYIQSHCNETFGPVGSIAFSSLLFGAAHIPNGLAIEDPAQQKRYFQFILPLITSYGAYFGWLTHKNTSLKESVAVHAWYDFAIFLASYSIVRSAVHQSPTFACSFSF